MLLAVLALGANAQVPELSPLTILDLVEGSDFIADDDVVASEIAGRFMDRCDNLLMPMGFVRGLTGDGYGGPCVEIDGYYRGGVADKTQLCFVPTDQRQACVIEIAICDGDNAPQYSTFFSVQLYDEELASRWLKELFTVFPAANTTFSGNFLVLTDSTREVEVGMHYDELTGNAVYMFTF